MARNYIPLQQVINDFLLSMDGNDYAGHVSDTAIRNFALRGLREMGFDMLKVIRSLKLSVNSANGTVDLPDDYVDWSKVGVVGGDGLVYVLGENKNINYSQKYSDVNNITYDSDGDGLLEREDDKEYKSIFWASPGAIELYKNGIEFRQIAGTPFTFHPKI